jgi:hypothetical protein
MSPKPKTVRNDDMRQEYDFTNAVRGKYFERARQGTNVVLLDPDVAAVFRDRAAVNNALRGLVAAAEAKATGQASGTRRQRSNKALQPPSRAHRKAKTQKRSRTARG